DSSAPRGFFLRLLALDELQFAGSNPRMFSGHAVEGNPKEQPKESQSPGEDERRSPAPAQSQPNDQRRGDHGAHRRPGVEDSDGQRALPFRKPFGRGFVGGGEVPRFTHPQKEERGTERKSSARQPLSHSGKGPPDYGERVSQPRPQPIDHHP